MNPFEEWRACQSHIGVALTAVALLGCHPSGPAQKDGRWAAFNGFYPGMSLQEAKAAGARDCKETSAITKEVRCEIPPERLTFGEMVAHEGYMEFYVRHEFRLSRMYVFFEGTHYDRVCQVLSEVYGTPVHGMVYGWHRDRTPANIRSSARAFLGDPKGSVVEFQFEPEYSSPEQDVSFSSPRGCMDPDLGWTK